MQYAEGDGPCLSAIRHRGVEVMDAYADDRWPAVAAEARQLGVTAIMAAPMVVGESAVGGLNIYSMSMNGFDDGAQEMASLFVDQLGVAAANLVRYVDGFQLAQQLQEALDSRAVIEQAKGIVMAQSNIGPEEAFDVLVRASQNRNQKLRTIAAELVGRFTRPDAR